MPGMQMAAFGYLAGLALSTAACGGGLAHDIDAGTRAGSEGGSDGSAADDGGNASIDGDTSIGGSCHAFVGCGGDVVGRWNAQRRCLSSKSSYKGNCRGEEYDFTNIVIDETWSFRADLTSTLTITNSGPATLRAPDACLVSNGLAFDCVDAPTMYAAQMALVGGKATTASCADVNSFCSCTILFVPDPMEIGGTYSISSWRLTFNAVVNNVPTTVDSEYCASDSGLKLRTVGSGDGLGIRIFDKQ